MSLALTSAGWVAPGWDSWGDFRRALVTPPLPTADWFDAPAHLGKRGYKFLSNASRYLLAATCKAMGQTDLRSDELKERTGIVVGTNQADYWVRRDTDQVAREHGAEALNAIEAPNIAVNLPASHVAMRFGYTGPNITLSNHHLAGLEAFYVADRLMHRHQLATMLCGSVEDSRATGHHIPLGGATMLKLEQPCRTSGPVLARIESVRVEFFPKLHSGINGRAIDNLRRCCADASDVWLLSHCPSTAGRIAHALEPHVLATIHNLAPMNDSFQASHTLLPLLQLLWLIANRHEGQVLAISPLGHFVTLTLRNGD